MDVLDTVVLAENASASTGDWKTCKGGRYTIMVVASGIDGSNLATVQIKGPDGSTALTLTTAFSANGLAVVDIPPGQIRVVLGATITGAYVRATRVGY